MKSSSEYIDADKRLEAVMEITEIIQECFLTRGWPIKVILSLSMQQSFVAAAQELEPSFTLEDSIKVSVKALLGFEDIKDIRKAVELCVKALHGQNEQKLPSEEEFKRLVDVLLGIQ